MSDTETEGRLDSLVAALSDDCDDEAGLAETKTVDGRDRGSKARSKASEQCQCEPYSGIRYRDPKIGATALDSMLDRFTPLHHLDKLRESLITISTIAIIGRRSMSMSNKGTEYIKWQLTDLKECTIQCFAFGDAAREFCQIRPGTVVALLKATYDSSQQGCLKVNDSKQMKEIGASIDFAYCAGHNRKGDRCQNVVNKSTCPFCDHHLQQGRKKLVMGARPECQGTVLGAVHAAQIQNPACLIKLSQQTPKKKKPQSLDQMKKFAGEVSNHRGSMGAKVISQFVQQQHLAARSARLDQQEAALYCSLDDHDSRVPIVPAMLPVSQIQQHTEKPSRLAARHISSSANKRDAQAQLGRSSKLPRPSNHVGDMGLQSHNQHKSKATRTQPQRPGGPCIQAGYVSDLLQEIAADRDCGQSCQPEASYGRKRLNSASKDKKDGNSRPKAAQILAAVQSQQTAAMPPAHAVKGQSSKSRRPLSTERRVRQVLTDLQPAAPW
eukprot:jgi/Ulvmu1/7582/UM038_0005.1